MLAGLGEKTRMREIKPRIWLDSGEIGALRGSLQLLYSSGGVITSRGLYSLRLKDGTKIGELDEEFVWERRLGDCFDFGGRGWRIASIGPESVEAVPLDGSANSIPFWKADSVFRSSNLSKRILSTLDSFDAADDSAGRIENQALRAFLKSQAAAQGGCALPGSGNIAVEIINSSEINKGFIQVLLHSFRGGALNYPLSLALAQDLEENLSLRVECFSNDDSILLLIPQLISADTGGAGYDRAGSGFSTNCETHKPIEEIVGRSLMNMGALRYGEKLLTKRLETTGLFGATFREAAERSLLIPRALFGKRSPLWITRQRSKRLFDAVAGEGSFPITQEAWRCCLNDSFDMEGFRNLTDDIQSGTVTLSFFHTNKPSPFAQDLVRQETNEFIYDYDERKDLRGAAGPSLNETLSDRVIREALGDPGLRPRLKPELISDFTSRLRREIPGWTAEDELSLSEWVKERIAVPLDEWEILLAALPETLREKLCGRPAEVFPDGPLERIKIVKRQGAGLASVVHREWEKTWNDDALSLLGLWLRYEGPVSLDRIVEVFGSSRAGAEDAAAALVEINEAVNDIEPWSADSPTVSADDSPTPTTDASSAGASATGLICDRENLEMLLRLARRKERPQVKERPAALLGPFLALRQGIIAADRATETEMEAVGTSAANLNPDSFWKKISAWPAQAKLWETEFFIARNISYNEDMLDRKIREGELVWFGNGKNRIGFCRPEDLDLVFPPEKNEKTTDGFSGLFSPEKDGAEGFFDRPRDFWEIKEEFTRLKPGSNSNDCVQALWREVWQGRLCADSFEPVRRGIEDGFGDMQKADALLPAMNSTVPFPGGRYPHIPRALRNRWKSGAPVAGRWFSLELENEEAADPLSEELLNRGRVRLLLGRWGILCRPLLEHESPSFSWSKLLPAMRRMELAGELTAGRFFAGINSLQFASPAVLRDLEKAEALREIYWMNAADPASPAGLDIEGLSTNLPERSPHNRLYFRGAELIAVSCRGGKELRIFIGNDDPDISRLITLFKLPRSRNASPEKKILIEKINGEAAAVSHFAALLLKAGFTADRGKLCLW
jgi:ATP-dependent Lhr-like helicase